jgi:DNA primase
MRAIPILKSVGISIKVLDMQPYKDPDEFIKNLGAKAYEERIVQAENSFLFEIRMLQKEYDMANPQSKAEFYNKTAEKLLEFQEELERNVYLEAVSSRFGIPLESLKKAVRKLALHYTGPKESEVQEELQTNKKKPETNGIREAQKILLTWLIEDVSLYRLIHDYINPDDFIEPLYHKVAEMLFEQLEQGIVNPAKILNNFIDEKEHREAAELFNTSLREEMTDKEKEQALNDTVRLVKRNSLDYISKNTTDIQVLQKTMQEKEKLKKLRITLWR